MRVLMHGEPLELPDRTTVAELLRHLGLDRAACAVAINRTHVPRSEHDRPLSEGDEVEVLAPMQGG